MVLVINEEQTMLKESARDFLKEHSPVSALRTLRDNRDATGYDKVVWQQMVEVGWACLTFPEEYGGLDFGYVGLGQVLEEMGKTLTASPMMSTVILCGTAINLGGNVLQKEALLPAIAEGNLVMALAIDEGRHFNPKNIATTGIDTGDGYVINGRKTFVLDGHVADKFIVVAKVNDGTTLFIVDANTVGITINRRIMTDSRNAAKVRFENVKVGYDAVLGEVSGAGKILEQALDIANICLATEMYGTMKEAFDRTLDYIRTRQQFGVSIGSFQGLQHRAADMYCEIELCKSMVLSALNAIDTKDARVPMMASATKAKVCQTIKTVSNEAIQMHGGIGMTDDEEIGFFLKRARMAQQTLGDYNYHLDRFATLCGY